MNAKIWSVFGILLLLVFSSSGTYAEEPTQEQQQEDNPKDMEIIPPLPYWGDIIIIPPMPPLNEIKLYPKEPIQAFIEAIKTMLLPEQPLKATLTEKLRQILEMRLTE